MADVLDLGMLDHSLAQEVAPEWWQKLFSCIQCGSCSASCPTAYAMDFTPRQLWQKVRLGLTDEVLTSHTVIFTCPSCYYAWSHLYPEMADVSGLELQHATEFLAEFLAGDGLALGPVEEMVTYHAYQQCKRTLQEGARKNRIRVRAMDVVELLWQSVQAAEE